MAMYLSSDKMIAVLTSGISLSPLALRLCTTDEMI